MDIPVRKPFPPIFARAGNPDAPTSKRAMRHKVAWANGWMPFGWRADGVI